MNHELQLNNLLSFSSINFLNNNNLNHYKLQLIMINSSINF